MESCKTYKYVSMLLTFSIGYGSRKCHARQFRLAHKAFSMLCAGKSYSARFIPTLPRVSIHVFEQLSMAIPCKMKCTLRGLPPYRFSNAFLHFPSAMAAESFAHINFRLVHLNRTFEFLEVFAVLRVCTAPRSSENAAFLDVCLDWLKTAPYNFIRFVCLWHWKSAVHTKWPCAYILKCACVCACFLCFFDGSTDESAFVHTPVQNYN